MSTTAARTAPYWYAGHLFEYVLTAEDTGGAIALMRVTGRPGFDPPAHVHAQEDEVFHILEGRATFLVGEETVTAGPGDTVWLPRGVPHAPRFDSEIVRCLLLVTPAAGAAFFREFSVPADDHVLPPVGEHLPDFTAMGRRMAELGIEIVGPPLT
jgi:quercetin dioxygenase-like cupin family protein